MKYSFSPSVAVSIAATILFALVHQSAANTKNLTFMFITSSGLFGYNSSGTRPAADIALDIINSRPGLLDGYRLVYDTVRDSQCAVQPSLEAFFDGINSNPVKLGVVGCGCSVASEPVAAIVHQWNIPQISYGTVSPMLSNIEVYTNFFRHNPPLTVLTPALLALVQRFKWTRIGLITQDEASFLNEQDSIQKTFKAAGIEVNSNDFLTGEDPSKDEDIFTQIFIQLEEEDYRVFLLNAYPDSRIICEAFRRNMTYPRHVWIIYGWYPQESWTNTSNVNCTLEQLQMVLNNGISVEVFPIPEAANVTTISGLSPAEFRDMYDAIALMKGYTLLDSTAAQLFDDIWGLALALDATKAMVKANDIDGTGCQDHQGTLVPLENFRYNNSKMGCLIRWNLRQTNFSGVSGRVFFNESLIDHTVTFLQYQLNGNNLTRRRFGTASNDTDFEFEYDPGFDSDMLFPDGVPLDGSPLKRLRTIALPLIVLVDLLAVVGILFTVCCLVFNIVFRERKIVKLTSPTINYFIISGAFFMYGSVFFYEIPFNDATHRAVAKAVCLIREWLFTIGYTLAYGAMLAKLWRVYKIFSNPAPMKRIFKDAHLVVLILTITGIAIFLLLLGTAIPQLRGVPTEARDSEIPSGFTEQGVRIEYYDLICFKEAGAPLYWRIFMYAYLAVLQILGIMLAVQTRRVKVKSLRDSAYVTANVYISSIVIVIFIIVTFVLRTYANTYSAILSFGTLLLTTMFLALMFVPKMWLLYKDPKGEGIDETLTTVHQDTTKPSSIMRKASSATSDPLERISSLEKKLKHKDQEIARLTKELEGARMGQRLTQ